MRETTPRREATRHRLVLAAIREFATRGIDATSVEQLCEAAGFTRGAFYSNFSTKDDVCIAILEHHREEVTNGLVQTFEEPPADAKVDWAAGAALTQLFEIIAPSEDFRITLMEIRLRALRNPALAARAETITANFRPHLAAFLEQTSARFNVRFRLPAEDLLAVFEAMYFHLDARGLRGADRMMGTVALALSEPRKDDHGED